MTPDQTANRAALVAALRRELVGPDPAGDELGSVTFEKKEDSFRPYRQRNGEEILQRDRPTKRYGVGVLYPIRSEAGETAELQGPRDPAPVNGDPQPADRALTEETRSKIEKIEEAISRARDEAGSDEFDLSLANAYRPSSIAVSFLADLPEATKLVVVLSGGRYEPFEVTIAGDKRQWWRRVPVSGFAEFDISRIANAEGSLSPTRSEFTGTGQGQRLSIELRVRRPRDAATRQSLITACAVNRSRSVGSPDELALFQVHLEARLVDSSGTPAPAILPYPSRLGAAPDAEDEQIALLYRDRQTFAVGHGCAADWATPVDSRTTSVTAAVLPLVEVPSMTNEIFRADGSAIEARMDELGGLVAGRDGRDVLAELMDGYGAWITTMRGQVPTLPANLQAAATANMDACSRALDRMREGMALLERDPLVARAFRLANHAMLLQQLRHLTREPRRVTWEKSSKRWVFTEPYTPARTATIPDGKGRWRPFQIAFLLMSIPSAAQASHPDRDVVELIWFPTGGGKTEAYLGLSAFSIFLRRLRAIRDGAPDENAGIQVLMRYTLRLLTAQQFQRAAALLTAMEHLRREAPHGELGRTPFSIGTWVGGTPNRREQARGAYREVETDGRPEHDVLVLDKCPWCRAQLGPVPKPGKKSKLELRGYSVRANESGNQTVVVHCSDPECPFEGGLPVQFIDEDIYDSRVPPVSLLIGTVDKFAMLAWRPAARRLFGRDDFGAQVVGPPELILQDELHLISGPLGSMVGLFETVIDELCTDRRGRPVAPKIVTSTATIRGYRDQVRSLFARERVALFPPAGLTAADSYFASYARDRETGRLSPGRLYVGVNAPGLGSAQTAQVRAFTALLQGALGFPERERDPWWTLLMFFNSLRELGGALTLFQSDIPEYFDAVRRRLGKQWSEMRPLRSIHELTGRLQNSEVREALSSLEVNAPGTDPYPVDACLASNIIEVGVDVDRLSLLAVVGQPKTTAQYIQVTGRVGRKWWERPGLIVTLYSASKPRDRSHFEKFRTYHERLYAQVEPTSVTPFSRPAVERALHAAMLAFVRQSGPQLPMPTPCPSRDLQRLRSLVEERVKFVDPDERATVMAMFDRRIAEWNAWQPLFWERNRDSGSNIPLLRWPGEHATADVRSRSWETPTSMRNVDAECDVRVTLLYSGLPRTP